MKQTALLLLLICTIGCKTNSQIYSLQSKNRATYILPFKIGPDHGIHLIGSINDSEALDFLFDTGANAVVISTSLIGAKVTMNIDGDTENNGADGVSTIETSSSNNIDISGMVWENMTIVSIPYQNPMFDAVLGWNAFEGKIVEIDYDRKEMTIHQSMKSVPKGFEKLQTKHEADLFYVKVLVDVDGTQSEGWLEYDTGSNGTILLSQDYASEHNLNNKMERIGISTSTGSAGVSWKSDRSILPTFRIASFELKNIPIGINQNDPLGNHPYDLLGNSIMKRFNVIIDFKEDVVYIKPNSLFNNPF